MVSIEIEDRASTHGQPERIEATPGTTGDSLILWRFADGIEVIETNGNPIWEHDSDFADALAELRARVASD